MTGGTRRKDRTSRKDWLIKKSSEPNLGPPASSLRRGHPYQQGLARFESLCYRNENADARRCWAIVLENFLFILPTGNLNLGSIQKTTCWCFTIDALRTGVIQSGVMRGCDRCNVAKGVSPVCAIAIECNLTIIYRDVDSESDRASSRESSRSVENFNS